MRRIGIYPGTFDPVHQGHLAFAHAAATACGLESVVFLPEAEPRGKHGATKLDHRAAMLQLAIQDSPGFSVAQASHSRFTVGATLPWLRETFADAELTLLIGSDVALHIATWSQATVLASHMALAVGLRNEHERAAVEEALTPLANAVADFSYTIVAAPHAGVSSSDLRQGKDGQSFAGGTSHAGFVTVVSQYARRYGLYA